MDNNCDGLIDEGFPSAAEYYPDEDGDGYGDDADVVVSCEPIDGLITQGGDCDDTDAEVNPLELSRDGIDNNVMARSMVTPPSIRTSSSWTRMATDTASPKASFKPVSSQRATPITTPTAMTRTVSSPWCSRGLRRAR